MKRLLPVLLVALGACGESVTPPIIPLVGDPTVGAWAVIPETGFGASNINGVAFGNGVYVAVGNDAKMSTSTDRAAWTPRTSAFTGAGFGADGNIYGVGFGNGLFVAVGAKGQLTTSTTGANWTPRTSGFGSTFILGATYANGTWVAYGQDRGKISTSIDGETWMARNSNFVGEFAAARGAAFGNGTWVLVGDGQFATSTDNGVTWTRRTDPALTSTNYSVVFAGGQFIAGGIASLATSADGIAWTKRTNTGFAEFDQVRGLAAGGGLVAGVGSGPWIATSTTGATWALTNTEILRNGLAITFDGTSHFVAVGAGGLLATAEITPP